MNKPLQNHHIMLSDVIKALEASGITQNQEDAYCYRKLSNDPDCCHVELYGLTHFPIKIKTAYAQDTSSNQAERYVTQISRMHDEVLFLYNGYGWTKNNYKRALNDIRRDIGTDHVVHLNDFEAWIKAKIKGIETH